MKYAPAKEVAQSTELLERLTSVTEQLEDIVTITRGKDVKEPKLSMDGLARQMKKRIGGSVPLVLFAIFRMFALKNLLRGRMYITAYTVGKQLGLSFRASSISGLIKELSRFEVGKIIVEKMDSDEIKIKVDGTITSMGIRSSHHPICYFERGLLSGALERLLKRRVNLIEETCSSQGDRYCIFKASLKDEKNRLKVSSDPDVIASDLYSKENIKLLTTLASHSISAIENTLLFEEAKRQSIIDGLTHIFNHAYFQQALKVEMNRSYRYKTPLTLIMMDVDRFKNYNDHFGHHHGDRVLKSIANLLLNNVREVDIVARYGGDEFAVILPQTDTEGARVFVNRIRKKLAELSFKGDMHKPDVHLTLSMGVASIDGKKAVRHSLLFSKADGKLLLAKRRGRNKVIF